jgi:hypothetical protein
MQKPPLIAAEEPVAENTAARSTSPKFWQPSKNNRRQPAQKTPSRATVAKNTGYTLPLFCFFCYPWHWHI